MSAGTRQNGRLSLLLLTLCLLLGYAVYHQLHSRPTDPSLRPAAQIAVDTEAELAIEPPVSLLPLDDFSETVTRPLFLSTRRPPTEEAAEAAIVPTETGTFLLVGIVITENERLALFKRRADKVILRAAEGDEIDGWQVQEIAPRRAVISRNEVKEELLLKEHLDTKRDRLRAAKRNRLRRQEQAKAAQDAAVQEQEEEEPEDDEDEKPKKKDE